ncbi:MAG: ABC transporter substrate-binding protein [Bacteroidia bacterium]|nr:ABC transporter substrate-binding protein [Bacteroidia bacterium]
MPERFLSRLFLLLSLALIVSCRSDQGGANLYQEKDGKIIYKGELGSNVVSHLLGDPQSIHPTNSTLRQKDEILGYVYERLLDQDLATGDLMPMLVRSLPEVSKDGLTYTFNLRQEAKWMDGSSITAEDILFNFKLLFCEDIQNNALKAFNDYIKDVQLDPNDPLKFNIVMTKVNFINRYIGTLSMMLNPRFYDPQGVFKEVSLKELREGKSNEAIKRWAEEFNDIKYGREVNLLQGGSGPYKLAEWEVDQKIVLLKREDYWAKELKEKYFDQKPGEITFRVIKDEQAVVEAIRQQSLDVSTKLTLNAFQQLSADKLVADHYKIKKQSRTTIVQLILNNRPDGIIQAPIFNDVSVRKAAQLALPLDEIMFKKLDTDYIRANSPVSPGNAHYNSNLQAFPYDSAAAKLYLKSAGWMDTDGDGVREKEMNGRKIKLKFGIDYPPQNEVIKDMMDLMKKAWEEVGFEVELKPQGMRAYLPDLVSGKFDASLLPLGAPPTLPFDYHQNYFSSNWPDGENYSGYSNAEVDTLINKVRREMNPELRQRYAFEISQILDEEVPVIYLYQPTKKMAVHKRFNNGTMHKVPPYVGLNSLELIR